MFKFVSVSCAFLALSFCSLTHIQSADAADMQAFLNAPAWQLEYEVTFKAGTKGNDPVPEGSYTYDISIEQTLTGALALDIRSGGPNLFTLRTVMGAQSGEAPSAQQQQAIMEIMMRTDQLANWISGGGPIDDNASEEAQQAQMTENMHTGTARVEYSKVETGTGLVDEMGVRFDVDRRTTASGSGKVMPPINLTLDLDSKTGHYLLSLPISFGDMSDNAVKEHFVERFKEEGEEPSESTKDREYSLTALPPQIVIDDASVLLGDMPVMEGTADPSLGKIAGEKTVPAHYNDGNRTVPGTVTFRYTAKPR